MSSSHEEAFEAVRAGDELGLAALLALDPKLAGARNEGGLSLVLQACYFKRQAMVELLVAAAPTFDIFDLAALPGEADRGAALLAADPGLAVTWSSDGFTPLHLASYFSNDSMAGRLLECGADPDAESRNSMLLRPLHSAAAAGAVVIVAMLLNRGADVNAKQHGGWTALHSAASRGDLQLVQLLLQNGAEPAVESDDGKTSPALAEDRGHAAISALLRAERVKV